MTYNSVILKSSLLLFIFLSSFYVTQANEVKKEEVDTPKKSIFSSFKNPLKNFLPSKLTEDDITQYIKAYKNIADVSPQIEEEQQKAKVVRKSTDCKDCDELTKLLDLTLDTALETYDNFSSHLCDKCRELLVKAVVDAGYKDFKEFLSMNIRIHLALHESAIGQLSEIAGAVILQDELEEHCINPQMFPTNTDSVEINKLCKEFRILGALIKGVGKLSSIFGKKLSHESDIAMVRKHHDAIYAAITSGALIGGFRFSTGGGFDD